MQKLLSVYQHELKEASSRDLKPESCDQVWILWIPMRSLPRHTVYMKTLQRRAVCLCKDTDAETRLSEVGADLFTIIQVFNADGRLLCTQFGK